MEQPTSAFDAQCLDALAALGKTVVQLSLYGPEHPSVLETLQAGEVLIGQALSASAQGALTFAKDQDKWLVNGRIVGFVKQVGGPVSTLIDRHKLSSVTLKAGLTTSDLIAICELAAQPHDSKTDASVFLAERKVTAIMFNAAVYAEVGPDGKSAAGPGAGEGAGGAAGKSEDAAKAGGLVGSIEGQTIETSIRILVKKVARDADEEARLYKLIMDQLRRDIERNVAQATALLRQEKGVVESERARTENLLDTVGGGAIIVDEAGKIMMMNPAAEEIYGEKLAAAAGQPIASKDGSSRVVALASEIEASVGKPLSKDVEVRGSDATRRLIRSSWAIVKNEAGRVVGMVLALTDLAAHKKAETIEREFVARVTHELRSPLSSIVAGVDLLQREFGKTADPDQKAIFNSCMANADRLTGLVNSILDFSRIESGAMTVFPKATDPVALGSAAVNSLLPWAAKKGLSLSFASDASLPEVLADPERAQQVLVNLISNSLKFTPRGGRVLVTAAVSPAEPDRFVVFSVRDNGRGIAPADRERVFEKFVRVDEGTEGTGLGLPIAKAMVELQGGRLWLESEVGKGSIFSFNLPSHLVYAAAPPTPAQAEPKPWWKRLFGLS